MITTNHIAADFMSWAGEHIVCLQLLNENRQAIAIADFRDGRLERFDFAKSVEEEAKKWLVGCRAFFGKE